MGKIFYHPTLPEQDLKLAVAPSLLSMTLSLCILLFNPSYVTFKNCDKVSNEFCLSNQSYRRKHMLINIHNLLGGRIKGSVKRINGGVVQLFSLTKSVIALRLCMSGMLGRSYHHEKDGVSRATLKFFFKKYPPLPISCQNCPP